VDVVLGLDVERCKKKISCRNCCNWLFLCSGRKNDRLKDFVELTRIYREQVLVEHG